MNTKNPETEKPKKRDQIVALRLSPDEKRHIGQLAFKQNRSECFIVREVLEKSGFWPKEILRNGNAKS
tara:strand:- start:187 stop:390 length:204 start_codon:yes stop_codon:yes gene_type:complete